MSDIDRFKKLKAQVDRLHTVKVRKETELNELHKREAQLNEELRELGVNSPAELSQRIASLRSEINLEIDQLDAQLQTVADLLG